MRIFARFWSFKKNIVIPSGNQLFWNAIFSKFRNPTSPFMTDVVIYSSITVCYNKILPPQESSNTWMTPNNIFNKIWNKNCETVNDSSAQNISKKFLNIWNQFCEKSWKNERSIIKFLKRVFKLNSKIQSGTIVGS